MSRTVSAPVAGLTDFFGREYSSGESTARGLGRPGARCSMHLLSVDEFRSSQTCSRCFQLGLKQARIKDKQQHKVKYCDKGTLTLDGRQLPVGNRQAEQCHAEYTGRLYVDRDVNAARVLTAWYLFDFFPRWMIAAGHWSDASSAFLRIPE